MLLSRQSFGGLGAWISSGYVGESTDQMWYNTETGAMYQGYAPPPDTVTTAPVTPVYVAPAASAPTDAGPAPLAPVYTPPPAPVDPATVFGTWPWFASFAPVVSYGSAEDQTYAMSVASRTAVSIPNFGSNIYFAYSAYGTTPTGAMRLNSDGSGDAFYDDGSGGIASYHYSPAEMAANRTNTSWTSNYWAALVPLGIAALPSLLAYGSSLFSSAATISTPVTDTSALVDALTQQQAAELAAQQAEMAISQQAALDAAQAAADAAAQAAAEQLAQQAAQAAVQQAAEQAAQAAAQQQAAELAAQQAEMAASEQATAQAAAEAAAQQAAQEAAAAAAQQAAQAAAEQAAKALAEQTAATATTAGTTAATTAATAASTVDALKTIASIVGPSAAIVGAISKATAKPVVPMYPTRPITGIDTRTGLPVTFPAAPVTGGPGLTQAPGAGTNTGMILLLGAAALVALS